MGDPQIEKAIHLNRYYAHCLRRPGSEVGWIEHFGKIGHVVGLGEHTVTEVDFAKAIHSWQTNQPGLTADGILGINTWSRLNGRLGNNNSIYLEPPLGITSPLLASAGKSALPVATGSPSLSPARGFMFILYDQLPEVGKRNIIRKVAVVPTNFALQPKNPLGGLSAAQHALGINPSQSQWLSASSHPFGAANFKGIPLLLDTAKIIQAGGRIVTTGELIAALRRHGAQNPSSATMVERLIKAITNVEGEMLIEGSTPPGSARNLSASHHRYVNKAELLWEQFNSKQIHRVELENGLSRLDNAYKGARTVGRVGRVVMVVGIIFTVVDVTQATNQSIKQNSLKPIAAETIRQVGGWGSAAAGAKIGGLVGAAFGIETGPGAILTGAVGAAIFGAAGYFGADWVADHISKN